MLHLKIKALLLVESLGTVIKKTLYNLSKILSLRSVHRIAGHHPSFKVDTTELIIYDLIAKD